MKSLFTAVSAAAIAAVSAPAFADVQPYVTVGAGYNLAHDADYNAMSIMDVVDSEPGYQVFGALGYAFERALRLEGEIAYRNNELDNFETLGPGPGDISALSGLFNAWWDFNRAGKVSPYIGGGIGLSRVKSQIATDAGALSQIAINDGDLGFTWQTGAGVAIEMFRGIDLDVGYRFLRAPNLDFAAATPLESFGAEYGAHTVTAALRFWGARPERARPEPQPEPEPARLLPRPAPEPEPEPVAQIPDDMEFPVYFDLDKSNLNAAADRRIREAAQLAVQHDIEIVLVEGHTDTSGSTAHNQVLSQARAQVVRQALIRYGVPSNRITSNSYGESRPARETGDGVREPLNRRAYVTIRFDR